MFFSFFLGFEGFLINLDFKVQIFNYNFFPDDRKGVLKGVDGNTSFHSRNFVDIFAMHSSVLSF